MLQLPGVAAGWIGVSMESAGGECFYHMMGLLYGKSPKELKQRVREVIDAQYDTDSVVQQSVRETVRYRQPDRGEMNEGEMSAEQLKKTFLAQLDHRWGGSAVVSILSKHATGTLRLYQPWAVNWERGGVVRLGVVPGASLHVFVALCGKHYYLLSRVPVADHRVHPYVFSDVGQAQACELAEWHNKSTAAVAPTPDHVREISKHEFSRH